MRRPNVSRTGRTRAALMGAGLELLAARPIDAIAIDDVVAAAGVSKGSFFNHFGDKRVFAAAIADDIRAEIEARVAASNAGIADPIGRLVGGMLVAATFAMEEPVRTGVLARAVLGVAAVDHPLNRGVLADVEAAVAAGAFRPEAQRVGVLIWLSCCQSVMAALVERPLHAAAACVLVRDVMLVGLSGLGLDPERLASILESLPPMLPRSMIPDKEFQ